jgi:hypothetical protein
VATPRFIPSRRHKYVVKTGGNYTPGTTWGNVDTTTDQTIEAAVGEVIVLHPSFMWGAQADAGFIHAVTIVSSAVVNYVCSQGEPTTTTGDGTPAWFGFGGQNTVCGIPVRYTVQAGDISNGQVTFRLRARTGAGNRIIQASATDPFQFAVENIGPQQAH